MFVPTYVGTLRLLTMFPANLVTHELLVFMAPMIPLVGMTLYLQKCLLLKVTSFPLLSAVIVMCGFNLCMRCI